MPDFVILKRQRNGVFQAELSARALNEATADAVMRCCGGQGGVTASRQYELWSEISQKIEKTLGYSSSNVALEGCRRLVTVFHLLCTALVGLGEQRRFAETHE